MSATLPYTTSNIRAWGEIDIDYRATVDRNGAIHLPQVGTLNVGGLRYQDLHGFLNSSIGRIFRNFDLSVNLGQLRSVQIFVVGQAKRPGAYTVSSLSTLVNALFASGGSSTRGSMRRIQLKRGDKVVTEFDVYDLLLKGDKSKDVRLLPGDVIYVPPIGDLVAISGSVNEQAGGPTREADTGRVYIVRADGSVMGRAQGSIFKSFSSERLLPRDTVVVPENLDRFRLTKELKDWSQIFYQFALGVAGLKVIGDL